VVQESDQGVEVGFSGEPSEDVQRSLMDLAKSLDEHISALHAAGCEPLTRRAKAGAPSQWDQVQYHGRAEGGPGRGRLSRTGQRVLYSTVHLRQRPLGLHLLRPRSLHRGGASYGSARLTYSAATA